MTAPRLSDSTRAVSVRPSKKMSETPGRWSIRPGLLIMSALMVVLDRCRIDSSVPVSTVRPARMIVTRWHSRSVSARMWLDSRTVVPRPAASATHCWKMFSINGSRPLLGSSSSNRSAFEANADTSETFCRLPFE